MENPSMKNLSLRENNDFARAINCTRKLTCVSACACVCDCTRLREQYGIKKMMVSICLAVLL